jgi:hypothetical protein
MMNILVALAAGGAAALMFASVSSGVLFSIVLVYFAPLPLMVAAMGWGSAIALVGGAGAGVVLAIAVSFTYGFGFVLMVAAPACWLGHLSLLAQPAAATPADANANGAPLDWYPIGRLLVWVAIISTSLMLFALLTISGNVDDINARLQELALRSLELSPAGTRIENKARAAQFFVQALPPMAVCATFLMYLLNLYVAGRIVRASGHLHRPWPALHDIDLPQTAILVLAATLLLSFVGGLLALVAKMISAALLTAYTLVGLAVLHAITQSPSGFWWRLAAYVALVMLVWPVLLVPMLGLLEGSLGLRRRFGGRAGPPPPAPST